jgi:siderophore synthetase component
MRKTVHLWLKAKFLGQGQKSKAALLQAQQKMLQMQREHQADRLQMQQNTDEIARELQEARERQAAPVRNRPRVTDETDLECMICLNDPWHRFPECTHNSVCVVCFDTHNPSRCLFCRPNVDD